MIHTIARSVGSIEAPQVRFELESDRKLTHDDASAALCNMRSVLSTRFDARRFIMQPEITQSRQSWPIPLRATKYNVSHLLGGSILLHCQTADLAQRSTLPRERDKGFRDVLEEQARIESEYG